jgi:osmotically-inducible protein OsmY
VKLRPLYESGDALRHVYFPTDSIVSLLYAMESGRRRKYQWSATTITTKVKTELAADHLTSLGRIHVDTDQNGVVWLTGSARSQEAIDKAVTIAKGTEHVKSVHNGLVVKQDD